MLEFQGKEKEQEEAEEVRAVTTPSNAKIQSKNITDPKLQEKRSKERLDIYETLFESLDSNGNGEIDAAELESFFEEIEITKDNMARVRKGLKLENLNKIDFASFCKMMEEHKPDEVEERIFIDTLSRSSTQLQNKNSKELEILWEAMRNPCSSKLGIAITAIVEIAIIVIIISLFVESDPSMYMKHSVVFDIIRLCCATIFFVEYMCRLISSPFLMKTCMSILNFIDILCIFPVIILAILNFILGNTWATQYGVASFIRVIHFLPMMSMFKLSRRWKWMGIFKTALLRSLPKITSIYVVLILVDCWSILTMFRLREVLTCRGCLHLLWQPNHFNTFFRRYKLYDQAQKV